MIVIFPLVDENFVVIVLGRFSDGDSAMQNL